MLKWLERAMPHAGVEVDNAIFTSEIRRLRWGTSTTQIKGYTLKVLLTVLLVVFAVWRLLLAVTPQYAVETNSRSLIGLMILISIGVSAYLDFTCLLATLNCFANEIEAGRWDLLRLTNFGLNRFIKASHAIGQIRAWRVMVFLVSMRLSVIVLIIFHVMLFSPVSYFTLGGIFLLLDFLILSVVALVEPFWQIKVFTAVGFEVSARYRHPALAVLWGFALIIWIWISSSVIIALVASVSLIPASVLTLGRLNSELGSLLIGIGCLLVGAAIYGYYDIIRVSALGSALFDIQRGN